MGARIEGYQRYKVVFSYVGTSYSGWQRNALGHKPSIQDVIEAAVSKFVGQDNHSPCQISSRTDAGVHAFQNVMHVDLRRRARQVGDVMDPHQPDTVKRALNAMLKGSQVHVLDVKRVNSHSFHARFSARGRTYIYRLLTGYSLFEADRAWCLRHPLNLERMQTACKYLTGKHDFSSFRGKDCQAMSPIKTVQKVEVIKAQPGITMAYPRKSYGEMIQVKVQAQSFLYHMVRNMVGTLRAVGTGKLSPEDVQRILQAKDRSAAPPMAPAHGLYLRNVHYDDDDGNGDGHDDQDNECN